MSHRIDTIAIESDEQGFELHLVTDEGERFVFNVQAVAEELHDQARRRIGPWLQERDLARATRPVEDEGPMPGETPYEYFERTGDDEPLRDLADLVRTTLREAGS